MRERWAGDEEHHQDAKTKIADRALDLQRGGPASAGFADPRPGLPKIVEAYVQNQLPDDKGRLRVSSGRRRPSPIPRNARVHNDRQIAKLAESIAAFGFVVPIIVDEQNLLLCGHARVDAAEQIGIAVVPAVRIYEEISVRDKRERPKPNPAPPPITTIFYR